MTKRTSRGMGKIISMLNMLPRKAEKNETDTHLAILFLLETRLKRLISLSQSAFYSDKRGLVSWITRRKVAARANKWGPSK